MPDASPTARGVYKPRRPHASPLFRLVSDHLHRLQTVYDERFASRGADAASAKSEAGRRPPRGAGEVGDPAACSTDRRPAPIEIPIPTRAWVR